jgi:hypothetical protein
MTQNILATGTRCYFCGNVHGACEIAAEWCASCGRKIPSMLLEEARFACATRESQEFTRDAVIFQADTADESKCPFAGLMLMVGAIVVGFTTFAAIAYRALRG